MSYSNVSKGKHSKSQREVIDLMSDNEDNVINLISDEESDVRKKPTNKHNQKANKKTNIAMSPVRLAPSRKHVQQSERARQEDLAARRKQKELVEMRRRLAEAESDAEDYGANSEDFYEPSAADMARRKMMKTQGTHLQAMWAQMDADGGQKEIQQGMEMQQDVKAAKAALARAARGQFD